MMLKSQHLNILVTMMAGDNFIRSYRERMAKKQDNETEILRFLKDEIFSTAEILSKVLNYTAASTAYGTLNRMCANGLLSTEQINLGGYRPFKLYGITQHGAVMVMDDHDDPFKLKAFEPSKITLSTLEHRLDIQRTRLISRNLGYQWKSTSNLKLEKGQKYPDGLMRKDGRIFAVEVERVAKSPKRYREIVELYLNQLQKNGWNVVIYLFPGSQLRDRVQRIFYAVDAVSIGGVTRPITRETIDRFFEFKTYEDFSNE
ncbi:hypothetical protein HGT70_16335 [Rosenbergiella collisarenosi]|uniref:MobC family replication-relaxation protein n=2 Tax=Erwiniaceae TaxID=1903409 RepID=UPI001444260D|nr:MobC family replication-relaxation protein [Rosenbergiella collisarenosi]MBT0722828.1 hypothetical protein [Rosenbergiella collisarenosi]